MHKLEILYATSKEINSENIQSSLIIVCADNLAANFSRELADYIIYIIDVSGGDKIPRKGGPGITQADLLVCAFVSSWLLFLWHGQIVPLIILTNFLKTNGESYETDLIKSYCR